MKDENIIEYIETLKEIVGDGGSKGAYGISYDHWKQLLDYITNLQEENMKYDQCLTELTDNYKELQKELTNLQEENQRLKEENKHIFANVNDDQLLRSNAMNYAELQDYKTKNEKAIPMLEELNVKLKDILKIEIDIKEITDIKNQLQGKSDE